jgi:hypothetical protein
MPEFASARDAKEFLAGRIAAEAERQGSPLSEVESKMLYFSETGWNLPEMAEVNAEFDRDYNQDEYEKKIGSLVGAILARNDFGSDRDRELWNKAVAKLGEGDHYLLVLVGDSGTASADPKSEDWLRPWLIALGVALGIIALIFVLQGIFTTR